MKKENKIFIQIASYRDPELLPTLRDCINKAKYPDNLVFSIAWQHNPEDVWDNLIEFKDDIRFKIIDINYKDTKGVCWARNLIQQQYDNEEYTLQLDSHHRFVENWDEELIKMVKQLQEKGYKKPLLTGYVSSYDPDNDPDGRNMTPWKMLFDRFIPEGAMFFIPTTIDNYETLTEPIPSRFYSAHFAFSIGEFAVEVPHDPEYYFHGEEISIAVRAYTRGYDLFHPHKIIVWHEYTRKKRTQQWNDDPEWFIKNNACHLRNRQLFGMDGEVMREDMGIYGFGTERTLEDYERYAGINFKKRGVQQYTLDNHLPPNPPLYGDEYENSFLSIFRHCIDISFHQVPYNDYNVWVIALEDDNGNEIYRKDIYNDDIMSIKNDPDGYCKVWVEFNTEKLPYKWIVWPHSLEYGWCERLEGRIR